MGGTGCKIDWFFYCLDKTSFTSRAGISSIISLRNGIIRNIVFQRSFK